MKKPGKKSVTRRTFVGAGAAAATYLIGCKTLEPGSLLADDGVDLTRIVRAAIHPAIGVARIGNSPEQDGYFIGPEVTEPPLTTAGQTRDPSGAIKRQAARFRIYGYDADGKVVAELTPDTASITWRVHLANKKAQWYRFLTALDIPESGSLAAPRRNAGIKGDDRKGLAIDPGGRAIAGKGTAGTAYRFDGGTFLGTPVSLGELRTDQTGRLLVLGGLGKSASPGGAPVFLECKPNNKDCDPDTFNNADGWYDDTSDGPVTAAVAIGNRTLPVDPAWVIVAPPNFAPDIIGWRTLYDLLVDTFTASGALPTPKTTSFTKDVLPALQRLSNLQWVNKGFAQAYGKGSANDFENPELLARLAAKPANESLPDSNRSLRQGLLGSYRPPNPTENERKSWPWLYGDAFGSFPDSPRNNLAVSDLRATHLKRWVDGHFDSDWTPDHRPYRIIEQVPLAEQPAMLDQAALHYCLADAFHPGCELTWPMRHASLFSAPFRIKHRSEGESEPDYGDRLTTATTLRPDGPLGPQGPGDLTRWMALPWQGDTVFCRSGYEPEYDPYLPTFWPARVPNHVLTESDYRIAVDQSLPRDQRLAAFQRRPSWVRSMTGSAQAQILQMVSGFAGMGIVEARPGVAGDPEMPAVMFVETLPPGSKTPVVASSGPLSTGAPGRGVEGAEADPVLEAGWESAGQLEEFRRIKGLDKGRSGGE